MSSLRVKLKLIPGVTLVANIYRGTLFIIRVFKLRKITIKYDKFLPFNGKVSKLGYCKYEISKKAFEILQKFYKKHRYSLDKEKYGRVFLSKKEIIPIKEIFKTITPDIIAYLGEEVRLDGMNWMISKKNYSSLSDNWHTDNVGNRLKVFVCVVGDGSQPTVIIPSQNRIPNLFLWLRSCLIESLRWFGIKNARKFNNEIRLNHKSKSIFIFDTQLLHRGYYKNAKDIRVIFHLEFSVPDKHFYTRGPIGTKDFNSFYFDQAIYNINVFRKILDKNRIFKIGKKYLYANQNFRRQQSLKLK